MENVAKNNDVIGDLYALRAGLSVISQINGEVEKRAMVVESKEWYIEESTSFWGLYFPTNIDKIKKLKEFETIRELYNYNDNYREEEKLYEKYVLKENDEEKYNEYISRINMIQRMMFCDWLTTNEAEEYFISEENKAKNRYNQRQKELEQIKNNIEDYENKKEFYIKQKKKYTMLSVLTIPTIIGAIVFNSKAKEYQTLINSYKKRLADSNLAIKQAEFEVDRKKYEYEKHKVNITSLKEIRKLIQSYDEKTDTIIRNSVVTYNALQNSFNRVLDERDWQYLDLIIYYLETGRADSKKEALQLLEKEIQTQRIIGTIKNATEYICSTIKNVASKISAQLGVISSQLTQIANLQQIQIAQNNELISQASMQNALIAKSNVTSEQLMKDLNTIKTYGIKIKI